MMNVYCLIQGKAVANNIRIKPVTFVSTMKLVIVLFGVVFATAVHNANGKITLLFFFHLNQRK